MAVKTAEKSNKNEAIAIAIGIHAAILLIFFFIIISPPNPPLSDSWGGEGVVLNIGDIYAGTGDPTNLRPTTLEESENLESAPTEETTPESSSEPEAEEEITPTNDPEAVEIQQNKAKDKAKSENKETAKKDQKTDTKTSDNTAKNDQKKVDNNALFPGGSKKAGDDNNKAGDPGNPKGIDPNSLYKDGTPGKGNGGAGDGKGPSLGGGIAGWAYSGDPYPKDESQEKGTLVFKVFVSEDGIVTNVVRIQNLGISPRVEKLYRDQLAKLVFDPVGNVPPITEGTVSYKINLK